MNDEIQFSNMDSWRSGSSGKFGLTFKQIALQHINRCVVNGSVEWHGGYWQDKSHGNLVEHFYVQNSREVFCNSVRMLRALLLGYFDKTIIASDKIIQEQLKTARDTYLKSCEKSEDSKTKREYYEVRVEYYTQLFEQLIMLSKRLNFFEEETSEEEM